MSSGNAIGTVVVAGGTGLIGRALVDTLRAEARHVVVLSRSPRQAGEVGWDARTVGAWRESLAGASAVVNLAGSSIGAGRWTERRKAQIRSTRVASTNALVEALGSLAPESRPRTLVCASGIDFAGDRPDDAAITEDVAPGSSFLASVCVDWEAAARRAEEHGVRVVSARTSFVVAADSPAFSRLVMPFHFFAGGPLGSGRQRFPWVHVEDAVGMLRLAMDDTALSGPLNVVAPEVPRQRELARTIGRVLRRPALLPAPAFALRALLGEMADLLLHGQNAEPAKALAAGYAFRFPEPRAALAEALGRK